MVSGLTPPSKRRDDDRVKAEVAEIQEVLRHGASSTGISSISGGNMSGDTSPYTAPVIGSFSVNPTPHIQSYQIMFTEPKNASNVNPPFAPTNTKRIESGSIIKSSNTTWEGELLWIVDNKVNDDPNTKIGIFQPHNQANLTFTNSAQTFTMVDNTGTTVSGWTATYVTGSLNQYFDKVLPLRSSSCIVSDLNGGNAVIKNIIGGSSNGQLVTLKSLKGKTLTLETGGNIEISSSVTVNDDEFVLLQLFDNGLVNVTISGGGGSGARAVADVVNTSTALGTINMGDGGKDGITVTSGGKGYTSAPTVTITASTGSSATATATVSGGKVTDILTTNGGSGYPTIGRFFLVKSGSGTGANKTLSNLTVGGVAVNTDLNPAGDEVQDLGHTSNVWRRLYAKDIYSTGTIRTEALDDELEFYTGGGKRFSVSVSASAPFNGVAELFGVNAAYKTMANSTGVNNAEIGDLAFDGYDSAVNRHTYASIIGVSENVSSGAEDGLLKFNVVRGSATQQMFEVNTMGIRLPTASLANPSANGSIFLSGSDVKIRSGGNNVNISNISAGFPNPVTTTLDMNAHTITGVLNPSNPTDVVTLDYFNSTGDGQWLELDGTGTMTGSINAGNNSLINVNDILTTRSDGTSRLINSGGTSTSNFVGLTLATGTDYYLRKSATDGAGYVFEWDKSDGEFTIFTDVILGDATTDRITFNAKSASILDMNANKITGVQNPSNPTDVVTLDYFNSTGDTQWLELDGTGTMTGNINVGNNNINNVNAVNIVRSDSTARMAIQAGTGATTQVLFDAVTNVDVRFTEALADRFEIQNSTNTIRSHVDLNMEGNDIQNIDDISFSETGVDIYSSTSGMVITVPTGDLVSVQIPSGTNTFYISENLITSKIPLNMNDNYIQFDEITPTSVGTVPIDERRIFSDSTNNSELSVKKSDGSVVSLEGAGGSGGADQDLNNLTTTSINQNLNPDISTVRNLGGSTKYWGSGFISASLYLGSGTSKKIQSSAPNDISITVPSGGDIKFIELSTEFFRCDGGDNEIIFSRPIEMNNNLLMGNNNITGINQLAFYETNQTITDDTGGMRFSLPDTQDTYDFSIDGNQAISIEKYVLQLTNSRIGMTEEIAPSAPLSSENLIYVDSTSHHLTIRHSTGTPVDLESGGSSGATVALDNLSAPTLNVNINANNKSVYNLQRVGFDGQSTTYAGISGSIWYSGSGTTAKIKVRDGSNTWELEPTGTGPTLSANQTWTGTNTYMGVNATTVFKTTTSTSTAYTLQLIQNANSPQDNRTLANIDFMAENSSSQDEIYARISASSQDITNGTEDGLLQLGVMSGGILVNGIEIEGGTNASTGAKIGFFGKTPVTRQSVSTSASNSTIVTALKNLGLFY